MNQGSEFYLPLPIIFPIAIGGVVVVISEAVVQSKTRARGVFLWFE
jgi:hypothetical protein